MVTQHVEDVEKPDQAVFVSDLTKKSTNGLDSADYSDTQIDDYLAKFLDISETAKQNEHEEKKMSLKEGLTTFPKAAFWSVVLSAAIIMEGYDTNLLNSFYAFPAFKQKYGVYYEGTGYQIPAKWQTSLSMAVNVGEIIGLQISGLIADRIGSRKTLISALFGTIGFLFIIYFSPNVEVLLVGEILCAIPWGIFQTLSVSYATEICPLVLRLYLTTFVNCCWVLGQLISSGVLRGVLSSGKYHIPWAIQWVWPPFLIVGIYLAPESPWWLIKKGKNEQAKKNLKRLLTPHKNLPDVTPLAEAMFNKIQLTLKEEEKVNKGASYRDCLRGSNFRRTRISSFIWIIQNITGSALMGYSTYFYINAGLDEGMSFTFSIIQYVLGLAGTLASWILSQKFGRFDIFFGGLCINFCILITVGGLGFASSSGASWAVGSLLLIFTFIYDASIGPLAFCVVAEIPSATVRTKSVIIARNMYNLAGIPVAIITPYMLNPTAWNWKAKTGLFWAGFALASLIWAWFEFPETKGRTTAELDVLFENGVSARKFKSTEVEPFNAQELIERIGDDGIKDLVHANSDTSAETRSEKV